MVVARVCAECGSTHEFLRDTLEQAVGYCEDCWEDWENQDILDLLVAPDSGSNFEWLARLQRGYDIDRDSCSDVGTTDFEVPLSGDSEAHNALDSKVIDTCDVEMLRRHGRYSAFPLPGDPPVHFADESSISWPGLTSDESSTTDASTCDPDAEFNGNCGLHLLDAGCRLRAQSDFEEAMHLYETAEITGEATGAIGLPHSADLLFKIGALHKELGNFSEATQFYVAAKEAYETEGATGLASLTSVQGKLPSPGSRCVDGYTALAGGSYSGDSHASDAVSGVSNSDVIDATVTAGFDLPSETATCLATSLPSKAKKGSRWSY